MFWLSVNQSLVFVQVFLEVRETISEFIFNVNAITSYTLDCFSMMDTFFCTTRPIGRYHKSVYVVVKVSAPYFLSVHDNVI